MRAELRPERPDLRPERADLSSQKTDLMPKKADLRPERASFRPEKPDGGTNRKMNKGTNKNPPLFYRTSSPLGPLPKNQSPKGYMW